MLVDRPLITAPFEVSWSPTEIPEAPEAGKVRVRTLVSLISSGTELRLYRGDEMVTEVWDGFADIDVSTTEGMGVVPEYRVTESNRPGQATYPVNFGYNSVGQVVELGDGVTRHEIGDRVLSLSRHQEIHDVRDWQAVRVPDEVATEAAPFGYLPTLGLHALRRGDYTPGHNVAVIGLGLVGFGAALVADALGARLACLELNESRRKRAAEALPDAVVLDPTEGDFAQRLEEVFGYRGIDIVIEAGVGAGSLDTGMRIMDGGGRMVAIALHPEDTGPLLASDFYNKEVSIVGTGNAPYEDPALRRTRFTMATNIAYLFELAARGRLALDALHTHTFPARDVAQAMADLTSGERDMVGVLLDWR